jgi:hypothetical protein
VSNELLGDGGGGGSAVGVVDGGNEGGA